MPASLRSIALTALLALSPATAFQPQQTISSPSPVRRTSSQLQAVETLTDTTMDDLLSEPLLLVDAMANWCGPCRLLKPVLQQCDAAHAGLTVAQFDVEGPGNAPVLVELLQQDVMPRKLPHLILFRNGQAVGQHSGLIAPAQLDAWIESVREEAEAANTVQAASREAPPSAAIQESNREKGFVSMVSSLQVDDYMMSQVYR